MIRYVYVARRPDSSSLKRWLVSAKTVDGKLIESEHKTDEEMRSRFEELLALGSAILRPDR